MTLRKQLELLSHQLADFCDENAERFDATLMTIREAHQLALTHHAADAIDIARKVTGPLSPSEGRVILAAMLATLPAEDTLTVPRIARQLKVSPDTVLGWIRSGQLPASNLNRRGKRPRWAVKRDDLDTFLKKRQPDPPAPKPRRRRDPDVIEFF